MKKPWVLIAIFFAANTAWAQLENVASKEPSEAKQQTEVSAGSSTAKVPSGAEPPSRNILVRNIPYQPLVAEAQSSAKSNKPVSQAKPTEKQSKSAEKSAKPTEKQSKQTAKTTPPTEKQSKQTAKTAPPTEKQSKRTAKTAPPTEKKSKRTEKPVMVISQDTVCRLGGYEEDDMSPEECRKQGGMMITTSQFSAKLPKPETKSKQKEDPSKQTEKFSLFNARNLVCRLRGYEMENMSPEECRKQGGVMMTTVSVPTRHVPPLNGLYTGKKEKFEKKETPKAESKTTKKSAEPLKTVSA